MSTADMLARSRAAQHVEDMLEFLHAVDQKLESRDFRREQAERIVNSVLGIYECALRESQPRKITTGLHRRDRVIGSIGV